MSDDLEIEAACTVALCVKPEEEWEWEAASELIKDKVFELSGPNNSIATKIDQNYDWNKCLVVGRAMGAGIGQHAISMKLHRKDDDCGHSKATELDISSTVAVNGYRKYTHRNCT